MKLEIISDSRDSAILVCDEDHNDIAEFYHNEHATVGQSYETALALAKQLVEVNAPTLSENVRIPLHELQADVDYLVGRIVADGSAAQVVAASIKDKLAAIETALLNGATKTVPQPFYGAECPSYPNCEGGCGLGCTHNIETRRRALALPQAQGDAPT